MCASPVFYLLKMYSFTPTLNSFSLQILKFEKNLFVWKRKLKAYRCILKDFLFSVLKAPIMS